MMSRNQHRALKSQAVVQKQALLRDLHSDIGLGGSIQDRSAKFGIPVVPVIEQDELHFSRPSYEVAASLLIVFGDNVSAELPYFSRIHDSGFETCGP
jgi:hypothetical protein